MYRCSEDSQTHRRTLMEQPNHSRRQLIRIDILPDDVLLEIFDFYIDLLVYEDDSKRKTEGWQLLVHVCQRWRNLVFASPRRLKLQLFCTPATPARDMLDVWPALPLIIRSNNMALSSGTDNVIAALGQNNRVCRVDLWRLAAWQFEQVLATMQVPYPELTHLRLVPSHVPDEIDETPRTLIPDSFLDGSAPRLRKLYLTGNITYPGLTRLLFSAPHLVKLSLVGIPYSGYTSPEAIVDLLSALPSLERLALRFRSPQYRPDRESPPPPPPKLSLIPALEHLQFKGATEYLEDLVTFIDAPQLGGMYIKFFDQIDFDTPRLAQFINRTFKLAEHDVHVKFGDYRIELQLGFSTLVIEILCGELDLQLSSLEQVCNSSLHPISTAEVLYIEHGYDQLVWKDDPIENTLWLQLLRPFTSVRDLYLAEDFSESIATALQELGGRMTEVLPSLQNIFVAGLEPSGHFQETIGQFVAARQLSDHPITINIFDWDGDADQ